MLKITAIGNLTHDVELKMNEATGKPYAILRIASDRRYKDKDGKMQLCHTLNNTVVAPPRMLIAFLENNLQADGSVVIPEVLRPYMGGKAVLIPKH